MKMHVHIGAMEVFVFALYLIIVGFIFRVIETHFPDNPIAKGLAFIH